MFLELSPGTLCALVSRNDGESVVFLLPHSNAHMVSVTRHVEEIQVDLLFGSHLEIGTCSRDLVFCDEVDEEVLMESSKGMDAYKCIE